MQLVPYINPDLHLKQMASEFAADQSLSNVSLMHHIVVVQCTCDGAIMFLSLKGRLLWVLLLVLAHCTDMSRPYKFFLFSACFAFLICSINLPILLL